MKKKILITGATGFIGQHVFRLLRTAGYTVTGISFEGGKVDGVKIAQLDLGQEQKVTRFFKKKNAVEHFDIIIHLAARVPKSNSAQEQKLALIENITSTSNILETFSQSKAQKFIYVSGVSVIAQPESLYVISKYFGEILSQYYQKKFKKKVVIFRISAPYGPGQSPNNVIPIFIKNALENKNIQIFGTGKRSQDFIYIDDVAQAFLAAVKDDKSGIYFGASTPCGLCHRDGAPKKPYPRNTPRSWRGEVYNIGSGQSTSTLKLARTILKILPESRSKIIFSGLDPQENYRLRMDISRAKKDLKFTPEVMIEEGIERYLEYLKSL